MKGKIKLEKGDKVLIQAVIVRRLFDERKENDKGYLVQTSRGTVMINPDEIMFPFKWE